MTQKSERLKLPQEAKQRATAQTARSSSITTEMLYVPLVIMLSNNMVSRWMSPKFVIRRHYHQQLRS